MSIRRIIVGLLVIIAVVGAYVAGAWFRLYGVHEGPGEVTRTRIPADVVEARTRTEATAAKALTVGQPKQILFGDLHVHTTFSTDAFLWSLPMVQGEGAHPVADACDYARFCSALDFWSINDHAEASTPRRWRETRETHPPVQRGRRAIRRIPTSPCSSAGSGARSGARRRITTGTRTSSSATSKTTRCRRASSAPPALRPTACAARSAACRRCWRCSIFPTGSATTTSSQFMQEVRDVPLCPPGVNSRDLPNDCYESAATPRELFDKLDQWGFDTIVIPHGNTWGFYSPPGITWDKQLTAQMNDPRKQFLIEIMSGHGNSEEYRDWHEVTFDAQGKPHCPEPTKNYLPSCWRAGEIIEARCRDAGLEAAECATRAAEARAELRRTPASPAT